MFRKNLLLKKSILILLIGLNVPIKADFNFPDLYASVKNLFKKNKPIQIGGMAALGVFGYKAVTSALEFLVPVKNVQNPKIKSIGKGLQKLILAGSIAAGIYFYFKFIKKDGNNVQSEVNPDAPKGPDKESVKVDGGLKNDGNTDNKKVDNKLDNGSGSKSKVESLESELGGNKSEPIVDKKQDIMGADEKLARELQNQEDSKFEEQRRLIEGDEEYARMLEEQEDEKEKNGSVLPEEPVTVIKPKPQVVLESKPVDEKKDIKNCGICLDDKEKKDRHVMSCCKNEICRGCLDENIKLAIDSKDLDLLKCPFCKAEIDEKDARENCDKDKLSKFNELKLSKILNQDVNKKNCPTPGCDAVFINEPDENGNLSKQIITCNKCKKSYCANCLEDHTYEETCEEVKELKKQKERENLTPEEQERIKKEEAETFKFVRPCPRCKINIQKKGGCKHMTCPLNDGAKGCGLHFCWDCLEYTPITSENPNGGYPHADFYMCPKHSEEEVAENEQQHGYVGRNREEEYQAGLFEWREGVFHRRRPPVL